MKKFNTPWVVASVLFALLFISIILNFKFSNLVSQQRATINSIKYDCHKMEEYEEAIRLADTIMDNNDLWDRDGSDVMSDYLNLRANMDTTSCWTIYLTIIMNDSYETNTFT